MTDIRDVPLFPGDIRVLRGIMRAGELLHEERVLVAQIIERYEEACSCSGTHDLRFHLPPCPKAHRPDPGS